ncbi:MAG: hypothetical protein AB3N23_02840 [Paracoccaceae bacterium]
MRATLRSIVVFLAVGTFTSDVMAQQACQALQGTAAHATCVNEQLSRANRPGGSDVPLTAPDQLLNDRTEAPVPVTSPDFLEAQAAQRLRLQQNTQARARDLSGRGSKRGRPQIGTPGIGTTGIGAPGLGGGIGTPGLGGGGIGLPRY